MTVTSRRHPPRRPTGRTAPAHRAPGRANPGRAALAAVTVLAGTTLALALAVLATLATATPAVALPDHHVATGSHPRTLSLAAMPASANGRTLSLAAMPAAPSEPDGPKKSKRSSGEAEDTEVQVTVPGEPNQVVQIIILVTVLGAAPTVLLLCTSFTKIVVVLALTRSALGTPSVPPNQVMIGLALFLSLFVMGPTLDAMRTEGVSPYMDGSKSMSEAYQDGSAPLREFMLDHTRDEELALMTKAAGEKLPESREDVELRTLIPAFVLSELRGAFIIGFVVFVPFLVIDLVVSAILMSLGMVMLPPSLVSLPFKILLFVLVDGWSLIVTTLVESYH